MKLLKLKNTAILKWAVPVLTALVLAVTFGCSEPRVRIVEVEKEVIKEVEVVVEKEVVVVVTATPIPPTMSDTPTPPTMSDTPTPTNTTASTALPATTPEPKIVPIGPTVSAGGIHACGLRENGQPVCWGANEEYDNFGQAKAPWGERFVAISAGGTHTCGLRASGEAVCWGNNDDGRANPQRDARFTSISAGAEHTCGVRTDGYMACWGSNSEGQSDPPGSEFTSVSAGTRKTCGLRTDGRVMCWGSAEVCVGRDGRGDCNMTEVVPNGKFATISASGGDICGLRTVPGRVVCLYHGAEPPAYSFMSISPNTPYCGVRADGAAICWSDRLSDTPQGYEFVSVSVGGTGRFACGLLAEGTVLCWGDNRNGQSSPKGGRYAVPSAEPSARAVQSGNSASTTNSFDAASLLARFSTTFISSEEGEKRANAVGQILAEHRSGNTNTERVIDLLHIISPELSITARRQAAANLANLSENDKWDEEDTAEGVFYLASVITGDEPNPGERMEAAYEMVVLYEAGELDAEQGLDLLDTIAPSLGVNERRQAAAALARLSADDDWDDADRMEAASEVFRLVTGVPLNAEERMGAAVDLTGVGVKVFDTDDSFDDREIDNATEIIKQSLTGELTSESLQRILSSGN